MIPRYEVAEVSKIWSEEARLGYFLQVEIALLEALETAKRIPTGTAKALQGVEIRPDRVAEIEAVTRHDVIAFCTSISEQVSAEHARYFHFGVTSSDVLDTALSLQLRDSLQLVMDSLDDLVSALSEQVEKTEDLLAVGRSHGMSAEPMVFAQKFLSYQAELMRRLKDYRELVATELTGQLSGAVGNYTVVTPEIEATALKRLNLSVEPVSSQVIPRDHLAKLVNLGALTASALERIAVEIRLLHHSDIAEVHEGFKPGQKGSSTMPHKKNPISGENITGLSRIIRSHVDIALENVVLWHERDISHSSTERMMLPDHFGLLVYGIRRMADTVRNLAIHREHVEQKVEKNFGMLSSAVLHQLISENSVPRESLYPIVQAAAFEAKTRSEFVEALQAAVKEQGLKWDASQLDLAAMKKKYFDEFQKLKKRVASMPR